MRLCAASVSRDASCEASSVPIVLHWHTSSFRTFNRLLTPKPKLVSLSASLSTSIRSLADEPRSLIAVSSVISRSGQSTCVVGARVVILQCSFSHVSMSGKEPVSFRWVSIVLSTAQSNPASRCLVSSASYFASWRCSGRKLRSYIINRTFAREVIMCLSAWESASACRIKDARSSNANVRYHRSEH